MYVFVVLVTFDYFMIYSVKLEFNLISRYLNITFKTIKTDNRYSRFIINNIYIE